MQHQLVAIQIERPINLDLHGMDAGAGLAMMPRGVAAGIRGIARHAPAGLGEMILDRLHDGGIGAVAVTIAQHDLRRPRPGGRWHRMAIDQQRRAVLCAGGGQDAAHLFVPGRMQAGQPRRGFGRRQRPGIDIETVASEARNHAQPSRHALRGGHRHGQWPIEHRRIQFIGPAVEIKPAAGMAGGQYRHPGNAIQQCIDKRIFRPPQLRQRQARPRQQRRRIMPATMRRGEQQRPAPIGIARQAPPREDGRLAGSRGVKQHPGNSKHACRRLPR